MNHCLTAERNFDFVFRCDSKASTKNHRREILPISHDLHGRPVALKSVEHGRMHKSEIGYVPAREHDLSRGRSAAGDILGALMRSSFECFVCMAAALRSREALRPGFAVQIQTNLQAVALEAKDAEI